MGKKRRAITRPSKFGAKYEAFLTNHTNALTASNSIAGLNKIPDAYIRKITVTDNGNQTFSFVAEAGGDWGLRDQSPRADSDDDRISYVVDLKSWSDDFKYHTVMAANTLTNTGVTSSVSISDGTAGISTGSDSRGLQSTASSAYSTRVFAPGSHTLTVLALSGASGTPEDGSSLPVLQKSSRKKRFTLAEAKVTMPTIANTAAGHQLVTTGSGGTAVKQNVILVSLHQAYSTKGAPGEPPVTGNLPAGSTTPATSFSGSHGFSVTLTGSGEIIVTKEMVQAARGPGNTFALTKPYFGYIIHSASGDADPIFGEVASTTGSVSVVVRPMTSDNRHIIHGSAVSGTIELRSADIGE